jgi:hypothetical protein
MTLISCLMPTYNRFTPDQRYPNSEIVVCEAVESFLRQDWHDKELLILNDTPGQILLCEHPQVRIVNSPHRLPNMTAKFVWLIEHATSDILAWWPDDDISLPHRLRFCFDRLGDHPAWRPRNCFQDDAGTLSELVPDNTHIMGLWRRSILSVLGGYEQPGGNDLDQDQQFNAALARHGIDRSDRLALSEISYLYRRHTGSVHLSGLDEIASYKGIGEWPIVPGSFRIVPAWKRDYVAMARAFTCT